jgi:hypothetical protein
VSRLQDVFGVLPDEFSDQTGPTGLMAGAQAHPGITVKIFVKENQIAPMRVAAKSLTCAVDGTAAGLILEEETYRPV